MYRIRNKLFAASMANVHFSEMSLVWSSGVFYFILWTLKWYEGQSHTLVLSFICISFNGALKSLRQLMRTVRLREVTLQPE